MSPSFRYPSSSSWARPSTCLPSILISTVWDQRCRPPGLTFTPMLSPQREFSLRSLPKVPSSLKPISTSPPPQNGAPCMGAFESRIFTATPTSWQT
jgi:hypothetical protein